MFRTLGAKEYVSKRNWDVLMQNPSAFLPGPACPPLLCRVIHDEVATLSKVNRAG